MSIMIKAFLMKTLAIGLLAVGFSSMEANAQQAALGRELKIVSFTEADKSDFDVTTPSNFSGKLANSALVKVFMPGEVESTDPRPTKSIDRKLLQKAISNKEIGIILLTERFGREFPEIIDDVKLHHKTPLIIEIPDRHGTGRRPDFITSYVNEAIGLKL